ncbi:class I histocompatibility antigen, F10 alpha chain [Lepisosteus oculatus]|uniref:class I histocompatibility antigen, F10 alpha chain n=1 Tax=Lepisosteus oculatus TaxID=7918 RepID=UPI0035F51CA7
MFRVLVLVFCGVQAASAVTHSLRYFYTGTSGMTNFPEFVTVGLVDGQPFTYYDSNIRRETPRQDWMAKSVGADYWESETQNSIGTEQVFKANIETAKKRFNQTGGVHTWQNMYGCELDDDGTTRGFYQFGYDGADYISLDKSTLTWTAANQRGMTTKLKWDPLTAENQRLKAYLENTCIEWLKKYVGYGRETLLRTERPQVSVSHKDSGSGGYEVTCLATGFFPKDVTVSWQRDGQELHEDVESGEVVPNGDGSFQVRKRLTVRAGEKDKYQYSCRVDHKSLNPGEEVVRTWVPPSSNLLVIIGAVVGVLLVLVAVFAGAFFWKKRGDKKSYSSAPTHDNSSSGSSEKA